MTAVAERHEAVIAEFDAFRRDPAFGSGALRDRREAAFTRFLERGFPTTRDEEWKFTNVAPIAATPFVRAGSPAVPGAALEPFLFPGIDHQIVLVNGRLSKTLSSIDRLPAGVTVRTVTDEPAGAEALPGRTAFGDLNDAFAEGTIVVDIAAKAVVTEPLHLINVTVAEAKPTLVLPRLRVTVGEAAQVSLVESYVGLGEGNTLTSPVTLVELGPSAVADHVKLQRESSQAFHLAHLVVRLSRSSTFTSYALTFGGRIARNDILAVLGGEGAECTLDGLYVVDGDALVDTHTTIDHAMPHCPSHEVYKGILAGKARAVFNGKIIVRPDAQKTDAKQTNKALLLTDDAQINTKPQLEIFADDVKCTHGAAIGQLDEDAMFYLRARGIGPLEARNFLIHAFAGEVLDEIKVPVVRDTAMRLMEEKLRLG
jgi:Fe-S cluster assembly protein SufD